VYTLCAKINIKISPQTPANGAPKSFFKALFINTPLGVAFKWMTTSKSVPGGLKPQEWERSPGRNKPPIPYIPEKDTIQDTSFDRTMKIMLPNKVELRVTVFNQGPPEQFLSHVQTARETIRQKRMLAAYDMACDEYKEAEKKLVKATEAYRSYQGMDENPPEKKY